MTVMILIVTAIIMCKIITVADHDCDQHPELYVHNDDHGHGNKLFNYNDDHVCHGAQVVRM